MSFHDTIDTTRSSYSPLVGGHTKGTGNMTAKPDLLWATAPSTLENQSLSQTNKSAMTDG